MSRELRPPITIALCALPLVLTLAAAPAAAFSESSVCHPIRGGETATQLARRITGDARNVYQPWFQVADRSSRFVPKSQYDRIRPGWRACIVKQASESRLRPAIHPETIQAVDLSVGSPVPAAAAGVPVPGRSVALAPAGLAD